MSLIHWWPLNGDMYDLAGNNHLRYINNNNKLSINNAGKFEKCYERTAVGTADLLRSTTPLQVFTEESICAWIYVSQHAALSTANGVITNHDHNSNSGLGIGVYSTDGNNYYVSINAGNKSGRIHSSYWGGTNIKGAWHHVCLVSDGSKIRMYVDGKEDRAAVSYSVYSKADYLDIFNWSTGYYTQSNYRPACKVCDVRVYNHALSDAEVKELSKALAVHYTFNDVLAEPTTNIDPCKNSLTTQNFPNTSFGAITRTYGNFHGFDCVEMYLNTTYSSDVWLYMNSNPITQGAKVGDTVTRSCWMYIPSGQTKPPHFTESIEGNSSGITFVQYDFNKCNTWQKISMTGTIKDTGTNNYLHYFMAGSGAINFKWYMRDFQMEIKDHSTPYTPTSRASMLYNETGLTQPNNITNIKLSTDTENGTYSLNCTGSTIINTPVSGNISSGVTISCWIKTPTYPTSNAIVFADYNSRLAFGFYGTQNAIIGCGDTSIGTISNIKSQWKNGWNHISVTKNSAGTVSCYLNGAKLSLTGSANHWSSVAGYSTIGGRNSGSYSTHFTGLVDDYRMYYTCLTDSDITELYKTKAYVTNKGDIEAHEFIEKTENIITEAEFAIPAKSTAGNGKIEMRNGVMAYGLQANTYYYSGDAESSNAIFKGKFKANTQYYFDLFMDVDTMWYSGGSKYVPGGFVLRYTDGTTTEIVSTSTDGNNGWKRVQFYSNPDKTVYGLGVYYWIGTKWYLRHDSGIYEIDKDNAQVTSKYTVETTQIAETSYQTNALIHSSGNIVGRTIIEI